jgi:cytochrome P450
VAVGALPRCPTIADRHPGSLLGPPPGRWPAGGGPLTRKFAGDLLPSRVAWWRPGRPSMVFPHLLNYRTPLRILDAIFWEADEESGAGRHNRYLKAPFAPMGLVTRDPAVIKAILLATGDKPGQFDRDTWPTRGIARATGADTILYSNGPGWRSQKKLAAPPFAQTALFNPESFHEFEVTFRKTILQRMEALRLRQQETGQDVVEVQLEAELSAVMLEMLANNFFGAEIPYSEIRGRYVPSIQSLIRFMVRDTIGFRFLMPFDGTPPRKDLATWRKDFEEITDLAMAGRRTKRGAWAKFESDAPDEALRSNVRVFLAGALEATTSMAAWALSHLARRTDIQDRLFEEIKGLDTYNPENLAQARTLRNVLEETLRLSPALYFLPRVATADTWIETADKKRMMIPKRTHVLLAVWHANRVEDIWGVAATGYPADVFEPARWDRIAEQGRSPQDMNHFGFGHGARVCPGRFLGLLEVGLVVGAFVKVFRFSAAEPGAEAAAGVSTKPADGTLVRMARR